MPSFDKDVRIRYIARLFAGFVKISAKYTDDIAVEGLRNLIDPGISDELFLLFDKEIALEKRVEAIQSLSGVFEYFSRKCRTNLHAKRGDVLDAPNYLCSVWWDVFPSMPSSVDLQRSETDAVFLTLFQDLINSESMVIQEIGLHGLGHWQHVYPAEIRNIISDYLARHPGIDDELKLYAEASREGLVH